MKTHKEYLDKQLSDKKFADRFYREKEKLQKVDSEVFKECYTCGHRGQRSDSYPCNKCSLNENLSVMWEEGYNE